MIEIGWERPLHQRGVASGLAVTSGEVIVHERSTRLVSLDPAAGSVRWDVPVGTRPRAVVIAGDRCLAIPQDHPRLSCLDLATGRRIWSADIPAFSGHLVVSANVVLVGGWRGYTPLRAFDLATGQLRWGTERRIRTVLPVPAGNGFLIGQPQDTRVRLIDRHDGRELSAWRLPEPLADNDAGSVVAEAGPGRFLLRCGRRALAEIVLSADQVREFARAETDLAAAAPEQAAGLLWLPELRGGYTVVDSAVGRPQWRVDVGERLVGRVVPTADGCLAASNSGMLFHLASDGRLTERTSVARRIWALRNAAADQLFAVAKGSLLAISARRCPARAAGDRTTGRSARC
ncbi:MULTISPECIES: outer membrane protein assembly factor BamB family protein [Amycolatopsis]|uniref:PQQ-binding-like beta-propeller repeat protein n=1 Tax=Amycolatopsis dendrobii TaxID=2760662 RepID=A0A7W3W3F3_9PSEU|nr:MULTISPECIES: PQQ-binding-like beta-propeller repeat protein [Amycolatopsis]MBB1158176.1 PQQ-binding-like beta-propeller repeat protein [Amycolatopsis dendrobii]UKD56975.1 PQQ-like beta-propeller repeat protein [Amycolatopsis sp. FU40]